MIKILSIGNSFSQDAQRYLYQIARKEGVAMKCVNLYIGGCSLRTHYINMLENRKAYELEVDGISTGIGIGIAEALASDDWDYVTLQQVSWQSVDFETYTPYLEKLAEYVRLYVPKAKLLIHQTWAYEQDSKRLNEEMGFKDQHDMLDKIKTAYKQASEKIGAYKIIPSGEAVMKALDNGVPRMHRDTTHVDGGIGRYMLGLVWYMTLTGKKTEKEFDDFDIPVDKAMIPIIKKCAEELCL